MIEVGETMGELPTNKIVFCERSWKTPVSILAFLIFVTFAWGIYLLDHYDEDDNFHGADDLSVGQGCSVLLMQPCSPSREAGSVH